MRSRRLQRQVIITAMYRFLIMGSTCVAQLSVSVHSQYNRNRNLNETSEKLINITCMINNIGVVVILIKIIILMLLMLLLY